MINLNENIIFPDTFKPKGLIKIELFDAITDKKVKEINTHNFISKGVLDYIFKAKMRDVFTVGRVTGGGTVTNGFGDIFQQISLTDADHAEDPNTEWLRKGKMIGYALTTVTYSGSDPLRGTYNSAESFTNAEQVHMVFDFPTSAANGTFNSLYFNPNGSSVNVYKYFNNTALNSIVSAKKYYDRYYLLTNDRKLQIYSLNWELINEYSLNDTSIYDFEIVDGYIYYTSSSSPKTIMRANINSPTDMTIILTGFGCRGITFDYDNQQFIITDYSNNLFKYYDVNFNLQKNTTHSASSYPIFYDSGVLLLGGNIIIEDKNENYMLTSYSIKGVTDDSIIISDGNEGYKLPKVYIGSRSLLESPVTKTSNVTMKITYDFILPPLF